MTEPFDVGGITTRWKVVYVISCMAFFCLFALFGQAGRGVIAGFSFASIMLVARVRWDLRHFQWFWLFMGASVLIHLAFVVAFRGDLGIHPTIIFAPLVIADFAILMVGLFYLEKAMKP